MILATGGFELGATSTRSRSASCARRMAWSMLTTPICSPAGPTRRTSGTRIRSFVRGSLMRYSFSGCFMLSSATVIELPRTMNNLLAHPELDRAFCNAPHPVYQHLLGPAECNQPGNLMRRFRGGRFSTFRTGAITLRSLENYSRLWPLRPIAAGKHPRLAP